MLPESDQTREAHEELISAGQAIENCIGVLWSWALAALAIGLASIVPATVLAIHYSAAARLAPGETEPAGLVDRLHEENARRRQAVQLDSLLPVTRTLLDTEVESVNANLAKGRWDLFLQLLLLFPLFVYGGVCLFGDKEGLNAFKCRVNETECRFLRLCGPVVAIAIVSCPLYGACRLFANPTAWFALKTHEVAVVMLTPIALIVAINLALMFIEDFELDLFYWCFSPYFLLRKMCQYIEVAWKTPAVSCAVAITSATGGLVALCNGFWAVGWWLIGLGGMWLFAFVRESVQGLPTRRYFQKRDDVQRKFAALILPGLLWGTLFAGSWNLSARFGILGFCLLAMTLVAFWFYWSAVLEMKRKEASSDTVVARRTTQCENHRPAKPRAEAIPTKTHRGVSKDDRMWLEVESEILDNASGVYRKNLVAGKLWHLAPTLENLRRLRTLKTRLRAVHGEDVPVFRTLFTIGCKWMEKLNGIPA